MENQMKVPKDLKKKFPSILNHILYEKRYPNTPVVVVDKKVLMRNTVDKKQVESVIKKSLPEPVFLNACCRVCIKQILEELSNKIKISNLYPQSYSEKDEYDSEKSRNLKELITQLERKEGKSISLKSLQKLANKQGMSFEKVEKLIEVLKRKGDIYMPKRGFISRL